MGGRRPHIAINADDDSVTQAFYEVVAPVQTRRDLFARDPHQQSEVSIEVDGLGAVLARVEELGERVVVRAIGYAREARPRASTRRTGRSARSGQWSTSCAAAVRAVTVVGGPGTVAVSGIGAHAPPLIRNWPPNVVVTLAG